MLRATRRSQSSSHRASIQKQAAQASGLYQCSSAAASAKALYHRCPARTCHSSWLRLWRNCMGVSACSGRYTQGASSPQAKGLVSPGSRYSAARTFSSSGGSVSSAGRRRRASRNRNHIQRPAKAAAKRPTPASHRRGSSQVHTGAWASGTAVPTHTRPAPPMAAAAPEACTRAGSRPFRGNR